MSVEVGGRKLTGIVVRPGLGYTQRFAVFPHRALIDGKWYWLRKLWAVETWGGFMPMTSWLDTIWFGLRKPSRAEVLFLEDFAKDQSDNYELPRELRIRRRRRRQ